MIPSRLLRQKNTLSPELVSLLDSLPMAALLVESKPETKSRSDKPTVRIVHANPKFSELTGIPITELSNMELKQIMPDFDINGAQNSTTLLRADFINNRKAAPTRVTATVKPVSKNLFFLLLEPDDQYTQKSITQERQLLWNLWRDTLTVKNTLSNSSTFDLETELSKMLQGVSEITGVTLSAVYVVNGNLPQLEICASYGDVSALPNILSSEEISQLKTSELWTPGKRLRGKIFKAARDASMSYMLTAPIGRDNAMIGLLAMAGANSKPHAWLQSISNNLPLIIESIIQRYTRHVEYLRETKETLDLQSLIKELLDNAYNGVIIISTDLRIVNFNRAAETILGYKLAEVEGHSIEKILIGSEAFISALQHNSNHPTEPFESDALFYRRRGEAFSAHVKLIPVPSNHPIPEARSTGGFLRSDALYRSSDVLDRSSDVLDRSSDVLDRSSDVLDRSSDVLDRSSDVLDRSSDGDLPIKYYAILIQDLTELEGIRSQTRQLEQQAILGEITAVFAHEVRNPINNISTGLELMALNLPQDDPNQKAIARLLQDCDRLAELMKSVLSYTRSKEYTMVVLPLEPFFRNILDRMRIRLERVNIQASLEIEPECPPVRASARALEQVFTNLINNAIQAMIENITNETSSADPQKDQSPAGNYRGKLVIKAKKLDPDETGYAQGIQVEEHQSDKGGHRWSDQGHRLSDKSGHIAPKHRFVEISVTDTGPGIPPDAQDKLFQPFFSLNNTSGTGLGLAISKRIINAHKGNIRVASFPGGTVFCVTLPVAE